MKSLRPQGADDGSKDEKGDRRSPQKSRKARKESGEVKHKACKLRREGKRSYYKKIRKDEEEGPLKVGTTKTEKLDKKNRCKNLDYASVEYDKDGWANSKRFTPIPYDLLQLSTQNGKIRFGWWTGNDFYSLRLKPGEEVVAWKKAKDSF